MKKISTDLIDASPFSRKFDDLTIAHIHAIDSKLHKRPHAMPSELTGSTGVDMEKMKFVVVDHL